MPAFSLACGLGIRRCAPFDTTSVTSLSVRRVRYRRKARKLPKLGDAKRLDRVHWSGVGSIVRATRSVCIGWDDLVSPAIVIGRLRSPVRICRLGCFRWCTIRMFAAMCAHQLYAQMSAMMSKNFTTALLRRTAHRRSDLERLIAKLRMRN
jgi:hypothetical protein